MKFCIKCGSELIDGAAFCGICGYKIPKEKINTQNSDKAEDVIQNNIQNNAVCEPECPPEQIIENFNEEIITEKSEDVKEEVMENDLKDISSVASTQNAQEVPVMDNQEINYNEGTPVEEPYQVTLEPKKKKRPIVFIGIGVVIVLCFWLFVGLFLSNDQASPKRTLEKYVDSVIDGDGEEMIEVMFPEKVFRAILKDKGMSYYEFEETFDERYERLEDQYRMDYGKNLRGKVRITDKTILSEDDIFDKEEWLKSAYGVDVNITDACMIECELTIKGNKGHRTDTDSITLYKIGRKWYILQIW